MNTHATPTAPAVDIKGLVRRYGQHTVLRGLDLAIGQGEFVALLGKSGCGKSTLLRTLAGLDPAPAAGSVATPARKAVVFQEPRLVPWKSVLRNLTLGLRTKDPEAVARHALSEVGLTHREQAWPLTLSGGEAQRAALARSLVRAPELFLLDEPFAALDALTRMRMQQLVSALWHAHGFTALLVTHDVDEALMLATRVIVLDAGKVSTDIAIDMPFPRRRSHPAVETLRVDLLEKLGVHAYTEEEPAP